MPISGRSSVIALVVIVGMAMVGAAVSVILVRSYGSVAVPVQWSHKLFPAGPKAVVDQSKWDLGVIESAEEFEHKFLIRNQGESPLQLCRGPSTCSCTVTELPEEPIPPGGQAEVGVGFSAAAKKDTLKTGAFSRGVTVLTNEPDHPRIFLAIFATVRRRLAAEPSPMTLVIRAPGQSSAANRSAEAVIYSQIWDRFELAAVKTSLPGMTWRIEPAGQEKLDCLQARSGYRVEVTLPPGMADGHFAEWIELSGKPADSREQPRLVQLEIQGSIEGRLTIHGRKIDHRHILQVGLLQAGESVRENLLMKVNDERRSLTIHHIETEPGFMRVRVAPYSSGSAEVGLYRIEVEIPRNAPPCNFTGERAGAIRLRTDHPRLPLIELKVDFAVVAIEQHARDLAGR